MRDSDRLVVVLVAVRGFREGDDDRLQHAIPVDNPHFGGGKY
jgi:hypothetical protein